MIPKMFHRIFLDDPIPEEFERYWERFQELHPDWTFCTWGSTEDIGWIRNREVFDACTTHAGRSDVLRYEIMASFGGIYVDTDVEPLRPFDDLLRESEPFAGWEDRNLICPTVLGSPPAHPAARALVNMLPGWFNAHPGAPPNQSTGPYFITQIWKGRRDVRLLEPDAFYPVGWWEKDRLGGPYPDESYSVHHWAAQWLPDGPPQRPRVRV